MLRKENVTIRVGKAYSSVVRQFSSMRTNYMRRLLFYAFTTLGETVATVDWSDWDGAPLFSDEEFNDVVRRINKDSELIGNAFYVFMSSQENIKWLVGRLPAYVYELWRKCLIVGSLSEDEVRDKLNIRGTSELFIDKDAFSWLTPTERSVSNYRWSWGSNKPKLEFVIYADLRVYLIPEFFPDASKLKQVDEPPTELRKFSDEENSLNALMRYDAIAAANIFVPTEKVTAPVLKAMNSSLGLKEFFDEDEPNKYRSGARIRIVSNLLCVMRIASLQELATMSAAERCRFIVNNLMRTQDDFVRKALMPQLHGKFAATRFDYDSLSVVSMILNKYIVNSDLDMGKWTSVQDLISYLKLLYGESLENTMLGGSYFDRCGVYVKSGLPAPKKMYARKVNIPPHNVAYDERTDYLLIPLVEGMFFMFAALGVMEIAYSSRESVSCSPFSGVEYWRLTRLGRYVLGLDKSYERQVEINSVKDFLLDSRYLIITIVNPETAIAGVLDRFAKAVSATRYVVTPKSFLRNCVTINDIERNITLIHNFVCPNPPQVWKDFFDTMRANARAVNYDSAKYKVFTINAEAKELQQYIALSPEMRKIAVCAQGFRVLVSEDDVDEFISNLREKGYLV